MDQLTNTQINDFNNPLAFARERTLRVGESELTSTSSQTYRTGDREASFRLITGAIKRLDTLQANLESMLELSQSARSSRENEQATRGIYGKLRSLSAGFDQVVDAVRFDGNPVFAGNSLALEMGNGSRPLNLEASKLFTYGEGSLKLSSSNPTAEITLFESVDDVILNQNTDFTGSSITSAKYIEGKNSALELDNKTYKVKTLFAGTDSIIELRDRFGALIERQTGVDLSGTGQEFVDFDVGVQFEITKNPVLEAVGDLDFADGDYIESTTSILYRRVDSRTLRTDESSAAPDSATLMFNPRLGNQTSGQLNATEPKVTSPSDGLTPLESGNYTLGIEYRGADSYIRLTDGLGRIRGYQFGVDLTAEKSTVTFERGLSVEINNSGFSENGSLQVPLQYHRKSPAIEDFDFEVYAESIKAALEVVIDEVKKLQEISTDIQEINRLRNPSLLTTNSSITSFNNSSSLNILSGGTNGPLSLNANNTGALLSLAANQLFSTTTNSLFTQSNQSPEQLASLQRASAASILSGAV